MELLIFDLGRVVIDYDWEAFCRAFAANSGADLERVKEFFAHDIFHKGRYEKGLTTTSELLDEINRKLNTQMGFAEFKELWTRGLCFSENREVVELLECLRGQLPLCLLSNTSDVHYEYLQKEFNMARHFDNIVLSYKVGMVKPEPGIYHEALRLCNVAPEDSLFIDDLIPNVEGARALNIRGHHFTGIESLRAELKELGLVI